MLLARLKTIWLEMILVALFGIVCIYAGYELGNSNSGQFSSTNSTINPAEILVNESDNLGNIDGRVAKITAINNSEIATTADMDQPPDEVVFSVSPKQQQIVFGSVSGTKYYNYGCKTGNRIKPDNRVFFANQGEALLAGYEPAVNCDFEN